LYRIQFELLGELPSRLHPSFPFRCILGLNWLSQNRGPLQFDDFDADSCIVVTDYRELAKRMFGAAKEALPSWWHGIFRSVEYIDPFRPPKGELDLFCSKNFRFWYQKEVRFAWIPDREAKNLDHLQLEVGDISDIARFVKL